MHVFTVPIVDAETFLIILARIAGIIFTAPVFDSRNIPIQVKAGLSAALALVLFPTINARFESDSVWVLGGSLLGEAAIGMILGLGARIIFSAVELAGQVIGFQMGLGIVGVIDPINQNRSSLLAQFQNILAMMLFFSLNIHHIFLAAVAKSYQLVPISGFTLSGPLVKILMSMAAGMFVLSLKIGAPIMAVNLFVSVGLGVVARTVPQINVFIVGFPLKIGVGLVAFGMSLPFVGATIRAAFVTIGPHIDALLRAM
jgi:flagellar biosynthesis protein FliR